MLFFCYMLHFLLYALFSAMRSHLFHPGVDSLTCYMFFLLPYAICYIFCYMFSFLLYAIFSAKCSFSAIYYSFCYMFFFLLYAIFSAMRSALSLAICSLLCY